MATKKTAPKTNARKPPPAQERPVLVTTEHRAVIFGYATDTSGDSIHLKRARNVLYWSRESKGFMGLAANGPMQGSRVGPAADIDIRKVTSVVEVTEAARERFESGIWS